MYNKYYYTIFVILKYIKFLIHIDQLHTLYLSKRLANCSLLKFLTIYLTERRLNEIHFQAFRI